MILNKLNRKSKEQISNLTYILKKLKDDDIEINFNSIKKIKIYIN